MAFMLEQLAGRSYSLHVMGRRSRTSPSPRPTPTWGRQRRARGAESRDAQGLHVQRRGVPEQLRPRQHQTRAVAAAWRRRVPAAHRLRERRQPAAGARQHPARELAVRSAMGASGAAIVRQLLVESLRWRSWARPGRGHGIGAARRDRRADAGIHAAVGDRDHAQRARAAVRVRRLPDRRRRLWPRASLEAARRTWSDDEGRRAFVSGGRQAVRRGWWSSRSPSR